MFSLGLTALCWVSIIRGCEPMYKSPVSGLISMLSTPEFNTILCVLVILYPGLCTVALINMYMRILDKPTGTE